MAPKYQHQFKQANRFNALHLDDQSDLDNSLIRSATERILARGYDPRIIWAILEVTISGTCAEYILRNAMELRKAEKSGLNLYSEEIS